MRATDFRTELVRLQKEKDCARKAFLEAAGEKLPNTVELRTEYLKAVENYMDHLAQPITVFDNQEDWAYNVEAMKKKMCRQMLTGELVDVAYEITGKRDMKLALQNDLARPVMEFAQKHAVENFRPI